ncbi:hypothetical protein CLOACE_11320 [Clostridium acetireducens DSM 10703]|jgi:hypothetical protein|uniref:Uncharacterized protein n=1 Tax=Clostridium acetireducens DSM 10703 TaxID=1121290 RepID=A0A1E8EZ18_9CLOT|nr:hypothetical protein [Clostridium acetireducens]OFI06233.1 hypothetical protein CLOACE_11320 [Clostridium acetireducens DSM 10703]
MQRKLDRYNPNYTYKKHDITIYMSEKGYPIIERTNNALLYPEGPKEGIDLMDFK